MGSAAHAAAGAHAARVRKAETVGESRRVDDSPDDHLAYSPFTGSLANASGGASGEEPNGAEAGANFPLDYRRTASLSSTPIIVAVPRYPTHPAYQRRSAVDVRLLLCVLSNEIVSSLCLDCVIQHSMHGAHAADDDAALAAQLAAELRRGRGRGSRSVPRLPLGPPAPADDPLPRQLGFRDQLMSGDEQTPHTMPAGSPENTLTDGTTHSGQRSKRRVRLHLPYSDWHIA